MEDDVQEDSRVRHAGKGGKRGKVNLPSDDEDAVDDKYIQRNSSNNRNNKRELTNGVGKGISYPPLTS
jgi:hypothetical protein